jgi:hypothetical protein
MITVPYFFFVGAVEIRPRRSTQPLSPYLASTAFHIWRDSDSLARRSGRTPGDG